MDRRGIDEMDTQTNPFDKRVEQARAKESKREAPWQEIEYQKPAKCIGCPWGTWQGTVHYCPKPEGLCVKEEKAS